MNVSEQLKRVYEIEGLVRVLVASDCDDVKESIVCSRIAELCRALADSFSSVSVRDESDDCGEPASLPESVSWPEPVVPQSEQVIGDIVDDDSVAEVEEPCIEVEIEVEESRYEIAIEEEPEAEIVVDTDNGHPVEEVVSSTSSTDLNAGAFRKKTADLRHAFTINDTFRFTRELFSNSRRDFTDTIERVERMADFKEVSDYIYVNLGWDPENPDVRDFMRIVETIMS